MTDALTSGDMSPGPLKVAAREDALVLSFGVRPC